MRGARSLRHGLAFALLLAASHVRAQGDDALDTARRLFADAVADEGARRYETALDKFRRVGAVKDTANVRYRIATCLEALGRQAEALSNYQAALSLGEGDKASMDAVRASTAHAAQLDRIVPRLALVVPPDAPSGTEVRIDDSVVALSALRAPILLDPGHHTVAAAAPGATPFHTGVTLPEGGRVSITIQLEPLPTQPPPPPAPSEPPPSQPPPPPSRPTPSSPTAAYVAFGLGGLLGVGSVVSFILRSSNLNTLTSQCPPVGGVLQCSESYRGAYNAAKVEGPLAIGLAAGAALAVGTGVWLMVSGPSSSAPPRHGLALFPGPRSAMLVLHGSIER